MILRKVKTGGHETRWSQIYHCLYCYFTGHFSIILNEFSFNHLLLFLLLTDVNERILQIRGENGPDYRAKNKQQHRKRNTTMSHTTNHPEYNYTVVRQFTVMTIVWELSVCRLVY